MTERNAIQLKEQLKQLGFGDSASWIEDYKQTNELEFSIYNSREVEKDQLMYALRFQKSDNDIFRLREYELTVRTIPIPEITIAGINTAELESRMRKADEMYNAYYDHEDKKNMRESNLVDSINQDLEMLRVSGEKGSEIGRLLLFKYWPEAEYSKFIGDYTGLSERYEFTLKVEINGKNTISATEAYQQLKEMKKEHAISDEVLDIIQLAINRNANWMAYNNSLYFISKEDVHFFNCQRSANEFTANNISDYDHFNVIQVKSIADVLRQVPYGEAITKQLSNSKNLSIMNEKNFEYLKDNIKYMGFGEKQHDTLEQHLKEGKESFQLRFTTEVNKKPFEAVLQFRKSDNTDMYFFNSYEASLKRSNGENVDQTFYLSKGKGVTAKEAYNLLEGRAVFKELSNKAGEPYKAWIQLDFDNKDKNNNNEVKQYHENYGYDLKAAVSKFSVAEMDGGEKEKGLMQSLQKGNIQSVSIEVSGDAQKMFIEANPQFKTINLYDGQMKRLGQDQRLDIMEKQAVKEFKEEHGMKENKQQEVKQDNKKSKGQKTGDDLDQPKTKNSRKKGMSL